jgi:hypothetical protein
MPRKANRPVQQKEYVILLPLKFNDGEPVPPELVLQTRDDLVAHFGGASFDPGTVAGYWIHQRSLYSDELIRVRMSGSTSEADDEFIKRYKETLKERFRQEEVYVVAYPIERF